MKWSYKGDTGPDHWGKLCPGCAPCAEGKNQSPIDISEPVKADPGNILFDYKKMPLTIHDNGHNIEFRPAGGGSINVEDSVFRLDHFHFHSPGEHTRDRKPFDMELHLVHKDARDNLAVVGVWLYRGDHNPVIQSLWELIPAKGSPEKPEENVYFNAANLLPGNRSYYRYQGSLTTPPCTEQVKWVMMKTPLDVSDAQVQFFLSLIGPNARPVQPLNDRKVYEFEYEES